MATETPEKDVAYYLTHPDEVDPSNTELVQKLIAAEGETSGTPETTTTTDDKPDAAKADVAKTAEPAKADATKGADGKEAKPSGEEEDLETKAAGIVTADGKHLIPISVLQQAREAGTAAEAALREMTENYLHLEGQFKALMAGKAPEPKDDARTADDMQEVLAKVEAEAPWMVEHFERILKSQRALEERVAHLNAQAENEDAQIKAQLQTESAKALDGNPTLLLWQAKAPELFHEASQFDVYLRCHPEEWKRYVREDGSVDFAKRFEDVVEIVRARHRGEDIPLPTAIETKDPGKAKAPDPDPEKTKAIARQRLAEADHSLTTLSDLPGGAAAAQSEQEAIENESITSLGNRLSQMPPEKLQAWLARNG